MLRRLLFLLGLGLSVGQQCPDGLFAIETSCVSSCPPGYLTEGLRCTRCPLSFNGKCVSTCPPGTTQMSDQCVPGCGSMFILPTGECTTSCPTGTYASGSQCIPGCAPGLFMVATTGACVRTCPDATIPSGPMCIPDCPIGQFPMNGKCVSPTDMCDSLVRGSQMIGSVCRCPPTMWMERATNVSAIGICTASSDSSALVNCPSFVANSVFDAKLMSCTCSGSIIANIADKQYPFICGSATDISVVRCNETARFDLLEGECKLVGGSTLPTALPSRPSMTPMPSIEITMKPNVVSRTPKPTQRTDIIWRPEVSRQPLPSLRPLFTPLRASPMPTPWRPVKPMEPIIERPPYIQSTLRLAAADETAIRKPEKLQELQASLACSLRMPIENIRIMNITVFQNDGSRKVIIPDFTPLSGNGSVQCFTLVRGSRFLRSRSLQQTGSVDIDYAIVDPSYDILSLTPTEFSVIVGGSVAAVASSVGSTGISVSSEATPTQTAATTSSGSTIQVGAIAGGVVGSIAIALAGVVVYRVATRKKRIVRTAPVAEVVRSNPLQTTSARMVFTPATTRTGV